METDSNLFVSSSRPEEIVNKLYKISNRAANQHLCFRYTDSTIPLLPNSKFSSL